MKESVSQRQAGAWVWPTSDDRIPVNLEAYYLEEYPKAGLSIVHAARKIDDNYEARRNRKRAEIAYLVKYGNHAIAERIYYRLARMFDLPQQHVFWVVPGSDDLVAVAIQFEADAFYPKEIDALGGTVTYRRQKRFIPNVLDFLRHRVLHTFGGSLDGNEAMIKGAVLFGIDAADCTPIARDVAFWDWVIQYFRMNDPAELPCALKMMHTIAKRPEVADLVVQELRESPYLIVRENQVAYGAALRATHTALQQALAKLDG
jgi:hypothetical protein